MDYESSSHNSDTQTANARDKHSLSQTPSITPKMFRSSTKLATTTITRGNPLTCTNINPKTLYHSITAKHESNTYPKKLLNLLLPVILPNKWKILLAMCQYCPITQSQQINLSKALLPSCMKNRLAKVCNYLIQTNTQQICIYLPPFPTLIHQKPKITKN